MATTTKATEQAPTESAPASFAGIVGSFLEGLAAVTRMAVTQSIARYQELWDGLAPWYDQYNTAHRAEQESRNVKEVTNLGGKAFRDRLLGNDQTKEGAADLLEQHVRDAIFFGRHSTLETEESYNAHCAMSKKIGSWSGGSGYLAWLADIAGEYRKPDGTLTDAGVKREESRKAGKVVDTTAVVDLGTGDHIGQFQGSSEYARARAMLAMLHDMSWQVDGFIGGLDAEVQKKVRKDFAAFVKEAQTV